MYLTTQKWVIKYGGMGFRRKYTMRLYEFSLRPTQTIKPKLPLSLAQARISRLEKNVELGKQRLKTEKDRQMQQRDVEQLRMQRLKIVSQR